MQFYTILTHILLSMVSSSRILSNSVWPNEMQSLQDSSNLLSNSYRQLWGNYSTPPYDEAQWANTVTLERPLGSSYFGGVTALSGEYMFVGASSSCGSQTLSSRTQCSVYANTAASTGDNGLGVNGNGIGNGTVYVYKYIDPYLQWQLYQNLTVEGSYEFGYSIEVKGSIAVIGAPRTGSIINENNENDILQEPESSIGAVYIFQYDGVTWNLAQTLSQTSYNHSIANNLPVQNFGHSLSLSADASVLVIGAPYKDRASTPGTALGASGTVWVCSYDTMSSSYILDQMIVPSSLMSWFGLDVAIGSTAITTYTGYNTLVISTLLGSGNAVYIYSRSSSNSNWILSSTLQVDSYSGYSLTFAGSTLLLTNYIDQSNTNNQGSVYTYTWDSTSNTFIQSQQFYNTQATMADGLGIGLAVGDENTFVAAASTDKSSQLGGSGLGLYVYSRPDSSSSFTQTHYIPVTTAYTYTSFLSMIMTPSPQIVVGGSNLESIYKARFYNFTRAPDPTYQPTPMPSTAAPTTTSAPSISIAPSYTPTESPVPGLVVSSLSAIDRLSNRDNLIIGVCVGGFFFCLLLIFIVMCLRGNTRQAKVFIENDGLPPPEGEEQEEFLEGEEGYDGYGGEGGDRDRGEYDDNGYIEEGGAVYNHSNDNYNNNDDAVLSALHTPGNTTQPVPATTTPHDNTKTTSNKLQLPPLSPSTSNPYPYPTDIESPRS